MSEESSYSGVCSNSNQLPSFFKNSCTGTDSVHEDTDQSIISVVESEGNISHKNWTRSLQHFPGFSENKIEEALIKQSGCFSERRNAPKAYKNKKLGYRIWKEGFLRSISVKPNVQGSMHVFLVKCRVHASMKMFHIMYMCISTKEVATSFTLSVAAKLVKEAAASTWQLFCFPWSTIQTWVIL